MTDETDDETALVPSDFDADEERILHLHESIAHSRRQISDSLDQVRSEVQQAVDWRGWVEEHPWESVGLAFGVGFILGFR